MDRWCKVVLRRRSARAEGPYASVVLILETDRVIPLFDLSERDRREEAIKERR